MFKSFFSKISPFLIVKEAKAGARKITANEQRLVDYCALSPEEAQKRLSSGPAGVTTVCREVAARRIWFQRTSRG